MGLLAMVGIWCLVLLNSALAVGAESPRVTLAVAPEFPPLGNYSRVSGEVKVVVEADASGKPVSAKVISGNPLLMEAALLAAREWRFGSAGKAELSFLFRLVPENACSQKVLSRFRPPYGAEVAVRKARASCDDCGPEKPIEYERCE